ncbi:uncharacterized protein BDW43DRAFT_247806 [Aspergillus alliaceus]|uniref:uncharacterized protein n=1 Tax=Petromyces alliaceus TaxID=209559 RepID=UPI0012A64DE2|nr:uncharacterized protein BDW43DRAFT_247806 [Aspergillus alliaceus]KAB8227381.1 hypothetical protein BDW43DRAFT_247806 [Aspergillus alliaceus]
MLLSLLSVMRVKSIVLLLVIANTAASDPLCLSPLTAPGSQAYKTCCSSRTDGKEFVDGIEFEYKCGMMVTSTSGRGVCADSAWQCAKRCAADPSCTAASWSVSIEKCYLSTTRSPNVRSAPSGVEVLFLNKTGNKIENPCPDGCQPKTETPCPETPCPEKPCPEKPCPEKPCPEKPCPEKPCPEKPCPETPCPETPCPETPCPETPCPPCPEIPCPPCPPCPPPNCRVCEEALSKCVQEKSILERDLGVCRKQVTDWQTGYYQLESQLRTCQSTAGQLQGQITALSNELNTCRSTPPNVHSGCPSSHNQRITVGSSTFTTLCNTVIRTRSVKPIKNVLDYKTCLHYCANDPQCLSVSYNEGSFAGYNSLTCYLVVQHESPLTQPADGTISALRA